MAREVPNNNLSVYMDSDLKFIYGTKIVKKYNNVTYEGEVIMYNNERRTYKIRYLDGTEEEMNHQQVNTHLKRHRRNRRNNNRRRAIATSITGQTNLLGEVISDKDSNTFENEYPEFPAENCSIITYQNTGQQPFLMNDWKSTNTSKAFKNSNANIALYAEISLCEEKIPAGQKFNDRMRRYNPRSYSVVNSNKHLMNNTPWNLVGATALTMDESFASHRTNQSIAKDPSGLGRWVSVRLKGRQQMYTRFVSAYRPCQNPGISTTWVRHLNYFRTIGIDSENPRDKFDEDLATEKRSWKEEGDNIIIEIDMNENAYCGKLHSVLNACGLKPLIGNHHHTESPPATYNGNNNRVTIEEIWGTEIVEVNRAGFMPFGEDIILAPSDGHRMLWVEVKNDSILGKETPHSHKFRDPSKFPSNDPRCKKSFSRHVRKDHFKNDIFNAKKNLSLAVKRYKNGTLKNATSFKRKYTKRFNSIQASTAKNTPPLLSVGGIP